VSPVRVELPCACSPAATVRVRAEASRALPPVARCVRCGREHALQLDGLSAEGGVRRCLACGHAELYRMKAFPRPLGVAVVVVAAVLAPFTYYLSLLLAAVVDVTLYAIVPDVLVCYACKATHHGFPPAPRHPRFDREIDERLKFGPKAVMGKPMRAGGTADAPEPEH
jgi:hypothetical protein